MIAVLSPLRKALRPATAVAAALTLAACDPVSLPGGNTGPTVNPAKPTTVALLLPKSDAEAGAVARDMENAARLALAKFPDAKIDLKVYDTGGIAATAGAQAQLAVDEGAKIIIGPLRADAVNAAGLAVVDEGVNVLGFSNNPTIAGGNVFILSPTFANTANRLMSYAKKQGKGSVVVVHSNDVSGQFGKLAVEQAAASNGVSVLSSEGYDLSIQGVTNTARNAGRVISSGQADSVFITTEAANAAMPMLLTQLPEAGAAPESVQYIGLTRWDVKPEIFSQRGAEGAWFTLPSQSQQAAFNASYGASYGASPNPLASVAYDGVTAVATLLQSGSKEALTAAELTRSSGFNGASGLFRLKADGTTQRALSVATIRNQKVEVLDPAPSRFTGAGF